MQVLSWRPQESTQHSGDKERKRRWYFSLTFSLFAIIYPMFAVRFNQFVINTQINTDKMLKNAKYKLVNSSIFFC